MKLLVNGMDGSAPVSKDDVDLDLMMGTLTLDNPPPADIDLVSHHTHIVVIVYIMYIMIQHFL